MDCGFLFLAVLYSVIVSFLSNSYCLIERLPQILWVLIPLFLLFHGLVVLLILKSPKKKSRICCHGTLLLCGFYISVIVSVICHLVLAFRLIPHSYMSLVWSIVLCFAVNFLLFWEGILCVYLTSTQLGFKLRLAGILCGMVPVANLVALIFIIKVAAEECLFEIRKDRINKKRQQEQVCATKYPILLVHGVFFRDSAFFNYWGRIPAELEANGAAVFYGNQPSAASIAACAAELKERIDRITAQTGAEKVNIIAHSKGGLDSRYAISKLGAASKVASLTTINTPHRGCLFAEHLLTVISPKIQATVAKTYNSALKNFGEYNADFLAAVRDLTDSHCRQLNAELTTPEGIFCQSVGSIMPRATDGKFPLNFSYHLVNHFDGENDGLVSEKSFAWGEKYTLLRPTKTRGISHADMIDLNRENLPGFDVREFYVELVHDLKNRGL